MVDSITPPTLILPAFSVYLVLYELLHYHRAAEFFVLLDNLLVVWPSNFRVFDSQATNRS